jgi:alkylhydroperoxidase family enzyme
MRARPASQSGSERERATLNLTEAITEVSRSGVPDEVYRAAAEYFPADQPANLILAVVAINS